MKICQDVAEKQGSEIWLSLFWNVNLLWFLTPLVVLLIMGVITKNISKGSFWSLFFATALFILLSFGAWAFFVSGGLK